MSHVQSGTVLGARGELGRDGRETGCEESCATGCFHCPRIKENLVPGLDLPMDASGHDITGCQFCIRVESRHETMPGLVDQDGPFPTHRFGHHAGLRIFGRVNQCWMELDEFGISNDSTGPGGQAKAVGGCAVGIGGRRVQLPNPAGSQKHGLGFKQLLRVVAQIVHPGDSAILQQQVGGKRVLDDAELVFCLQLAHGSNQRFHQ